MVSAAKDAGFFQGENIGRLFYNAEQVRGARGVSAYFADFASGKKSAKVAGANCLACVRDRARNLLRLVVAGPHHPERNPLRRARTDRSEERRVGKECRGTWWA